MKSEGHKPCVVLGVTGGIAAYKACEILRLLQKQGCDVYVLMTRNACRFVSPMTFESLSGHPVATDTFEHAGPWEIEHIALAKRADVFLIAPATANVIAKMAHGIADDMLSTTVLATKAPVVIAPAMNTGMLENAATQENMRQLKARRVHFVEPEAGYLACGDVGSGKLAGVEEVVARTLQCLRPSDLSGLRIAVTAGPTQEALDPVRYLTNRSSGKMGYALAEAAAARGAEVTLLTGPVGLKPPAGVQRIPFQTTQELLDRLLEHAPLQDILIQAAAPGDYRAEQISEQKIKKNEGGELILRLVENPDVAATVGKKKRANQIFCGFAAETQEVQAHAKAKLLRKNLDLIVANDVTQTGAGFDVDTNIATLIDRDGQMQLPLMPKRELADRILDRLLAMHAALTPGD